MQTVDPGMLRAGSTLPASVYTREGLKLLGAGAVITDDKKRLLRGQEWRGLIAHHTALPQPAFEIGGGPEGRPNEDLISMTRDQRRGLAARLRSAERSMESRRHIWDRLPLRVVPRTRPERSRSDPAEHPDPFVHDDRFIEHRREHILIFRRLFAGIIAGVRTPVAAFMELLDDLIDRERRDPARFGRFALAPGRSDNDLVEQSYAVACLAIGAAGRLNWSFEDRRLAGLVGLLSDLGMAMIPPELRYSARPLDEFEINRLRRHPAYSVALLEAIPDLPEEVRLAASQHHERDNGSGYPLALRKNRLCDWARIAAIADMFAAATARRRYRPNRRPYDVIEELIMCASAGIFEKRYVRALVESVGLFPIGSFVELSGGQCGQVVAACPDIIDRPSVRIEDRHGSSKRRLIVHLADFDPEELAVVRAIDPPAR